MKYALVIVALLACLGLAVPASAASKPKTFELSYSISDNRRLLTIYSKVNPDSHLIKMAPTNEEWFRAKHGFVPFSLTPGGIPMVADMPLYIPDTSNMVAADTFQNGFLRDNTNAATIGALVVSNGAGPGLATTVSGTFNSTAPVVTNGQTVGLQVTSAGELITAQGGKTYVVLNQAGAGCVNLFAIPIRLVEIVNPGVAQVHPFGLYDSAAGACGGATLLGNIIANGTTGPVLGPAQFITAGVKAGVGLDLDWFAGGANATDAPYIQVQ